MFKRSLLDQITAFTGVVNIGGYDYANLQHPRDNMIRSSIVTDEMLCHEDEKNTFWMVLAISDQANIGSKTQ